MPAERGRKKPAMSRPPREPDRRSPVADTRPRRVPDAVVPLRHGFEAHVYRPRWCHTCGAPIHPDDPSFTCTTCPPEQDWHDTTAAS